MSNPQRPEPSWENCNTATLEWIAAANRYMDHMEAENRELRKRIVAFERYVEIESRFPPEGTGEDFRRIVESINTERKTRLAEAEGMLRGIQDALGEDMPETSKVIDDFLSGVSAKTEEES